MIVNMHKYYTLALLAFYHYKKRLWTQSWFSRYNPEPGEEIANFNDIYVPTWTRCYTYFMGMLLGYLFFYTKGKVRMPKVSEILLIVNFGMVWYGIMYMIWYEVYRICLKFLQVLTCFLKKHLDRKLQIFEVKRLLCFVILLDVIY